MPKIDQEELTYRQSVIEKLVSIESQTKMTNGRVTKLEKIVTILTTAIGVAIAIKFPFVAHLLVSL